MGMKDANLALSLFLPQVAAPCIPPSSHELVVSDSPFLPRQPTLLSFLSSCCSLLCLRACSVASVMSNSVTPWTVAFQAPLSMGFPRQEYRSGLPFPSPGDLPDPGIQLTSHVCSAL